ncbi:MAG: PilZ domain-containing protein [Candidatus Omnitrophica bacterium]|nr:PilZ domain-containing protein [Candidatus Omnitrophota bacterium]
MDEDIKKDIDNNKVERRKFPRVKNFIDVYYDVSLGNESIMAEKIDSKDTSLGGIRLIVYTPIKIGSILDLKFKLLENDPTIKIKGKVVWSNAFKIGSDDIMNYEIGIEFIEMSESDKENISKIYLVV